MLAERDDALKTLLADKSQLQIDAEGLSQRVRALDESEQRYKDENWSLETRTHELIAAAKDSTAKEQRLQQSLAIAISEKNTAQKDFDDVRQAQSKLSEDHHNFKKAHEAETSTLRKSVLVVETERDLLQRKIDELSSQNQELAKAVSGRFRGHQESQLATLDSDTEELPLDRSDTDHSPPPSPSKGAVRNSMLELETLKSSLHHAHRMIQNLKSNIHREKTEKLELKRMLQDSRDELEARRSESGSGNPNKRPKTKGQPETAKRAQRSNQLGVDRKSRIDLMPEDVDWEDHHDISDETRTSVLKVSKPNAQPDINDAYQTSTDREDDFETANEREMSTETEAFQTGNESMVGESSDDLTETEDGPSRTRMNTVKKLSPLPAAKRSSFISTASTSDEEQMLESRTPTQQPLKYRMKMSKGVRRSGIGNGETGESPVGLKDSPASFISNREPKGPSLYAELGGLEQDHSDIEDREDPGTAQESPHHLATESSPAIDRNVIPTVDSATMTDPWNDLAESKFNTGNHIAKSSPEHGQVISSSGGQSFAAGEPKEESSSHPSAIFPETLLPAAKTDHGTELAETEHNAANFNFSEIKCLDIAPNAYNDSSLTHSSSQPAMSGNGTTAGLPSGGSLSGTTRLSMTAKAGVLNSVLGWAISKKPSVHEVANDVQEEQDVEQTLSGDTNVDSQVLTSGAASNSLPKALNLSDLGEAQPASTNDRSSQTLLSSAQIDTLLHSDTNRGASKGITAPSDAPDMAKGATQSNPSLSNTSSVARNGVAIMPKSIRRLSSTSGARMSASALPPLPPDHREAIAAAHQAPPKEKTEFKPESSMGPPTIPASAYRPNIQKGQMSSEQLPQTPASVTSRPRYSTARSSRSRRSSVSSFESELDARFNIRADGLPVPQGFDSSTDPRMIQAITQTMIGEYLWKYTRKAGRGEMSDKRHRRFFWVHPYTRTLYWSDQDPSTAGRVQLKAKSVAIEAVRVVIDDNPMPPGLHRKSIVVITPGRDVKFTATTGQRHETWFNALSYLLLRSGSEAQHADANDITAEDVAEFNPGLGRGALSRISLSSYNSRANTARRSVISNRNPSPNKGSVRRIPPTLHTKSSPQVPRRNSASLGSRFSSYLRPRRASTINTKEDGVSATVESMYNASVANDSAEDVRQVLERQEQDAERLENVRACCDGEFLVLYLLICTVTNSKNRRQA